MGIEIVSSHYSEDLRWLEDVPWPVHIVTKEGGAEFNRSKFTSVETIPNLGMEASSYLWYIIKNYDSLPEGMAFIHGHEHALHQRPGMMGRIVELGQFAFADLNMTVNMHMVTKPDGGLGYEKIWDRLLLKELGKMPLYVNFRHGAQFVVSATTVRLRSRNFYEDLYKNLMGLCLEKPSVNKFVAMFMETFWHLIFATESPIQDRGRPNLFASENGMLLIERNASEDYLDLFVDMDTKICGPAEFMKKLASCSEMHYD